MTKEDYQKVKARKSISDKCEVCGTEDQPVHQAINCETHLKSCPKCWDEQIRTLFDDVAAVGAINVVNTSTPENLQVPGAGTVCLIMLHERARAIKNYIGNRAIMYVAMPETKSMDAGEIDLNRAALMSQLGRAARVMFSHLSMITMELPETMFPPIDMIRVGSLGVESDKASTRSEQQGCSAFLYSFLTPDKETERNIGWLPAVEIMHTAVSEAAFRDAWIHSMQKSTNIVTAQDQVLEEPWQISDEILKIDWATPPDMPPYLPVWESARLRFAIASWLQPCIKTPSEFAAWVQKTPPLQRGSRERGLPGSWWPIKKVKVLVRVLPAPRDVVKVTSGKRAEVEGTTEVPMAESAMQIVALEDCRVKLNNMVHYIVSRSTTQKDDREKYVFESMILDAERSGSIEASAEEARRQMKAAAKSVPVGNKDMRKPVTKKEGAEINEALKGGGIVPGHLAKEDGTFPTYNAEEAASWNEAWRATLRTLEERTGISPLMVRQFAMVRAHGHDCWCKLTVESFEPYVDAEAIQTHVMKMIINRDDKLRQERWAKNMKPARQRELLENTPNVAVLTAKGLYQHLVQSSTLQSEEFEIVAAALGLTQQQVVDELPPELTQEDTLRGLLAANLVTAFRGIFTMLNQQIHWTSYSGWEDPEDATQKPIAVEDALYRVAEGEVTWGGRDPTLGVNRWTKLQPARTIYGVHQKEFEKKLRTWLMNTPHSQAQLRADAIAFVKECDKRRT